MAIKKRFLFLITIFTLLLNGTVTSQSYTNRISGAIKGLQLEDTNKVSLLLNKNLLLHRGKLPDTVIHVQMNRNGEFTIDFEAPSDLFYFSIQVYSGETYISKLNRDFVMTPYLSEKGDSVFLSINVEGNNALFSGRGSEKLNCQYLLNRYGDGPIEMKGFYYTPSAPAQPYTDLIKTEERHQMNRSAIIESFTGYVEESILRQIRNNEIALRKYWLVYRLNYILTRTSLQRKKEEIVDFWREHTMNPVSILREDPTLSQSPSYPDFLILLNGIEYEYNQTVGTQSTKSYFEWIYDRCKESYSGILRDRVLYTLFTTKYSRPQHNEALRLLPEAISIIKDAEYRCALEKYKQEFSVGAMAFPFSFVDEAGKEHTLSDYADKLIVLDFWFTGCKPCTNIPPILKPIIEQFKENRDVTFLSVSVDSSYETWRKGLASEKYTCPGQIHLKTSGIGSGRNDPFVLHYGITGFPQLMVIGKKGILLSARPKDIRSDKGEYLIQLIKENVNSNL